LEVVHVTWHLWFNTSTCRKAASWSFLGPPHHHVHMGRARKEGISQKWTDLTSRHVNYWRQLQLGLLDLELLGTFGHMALAQLPALLILDDRKHAEGTVLPCTDG